MELEFVEKWKSKGFVFDVNTKIKLIKVYGARIAFDILAMVGVGMMFYRIKLGWTFYWIFQLAYVLVPFFVLEVLLTTTWPYIAGNTVIVFPLFFAMIHLSFVLLFYGLRKELN